MILNRLKEARIKANMTKADMARKLGVAYSTYDGYETGYREPKLETLQKIADALGVPVFLLYDVDIFAEEVTDFAETLVQMYSVLNVIAENPGTPEDTRKQIKEILPEKEKFTRQVTTLSMMSRKSVDIPPAFASDDVKAIFELLGQLNSKGQERAIAQIQDLAKVPDYQKETSPK